MIVGRAVARCVLLSVALLLGACDASDPVVPGPENLRLRIFERPFEGHFGNSWPFDHDLPWGSFATPGQNPPGNPHVLTWRGDVFRVPWGNGWRHNGHDWIMPEGTPLLAVADGVVVFAGPEEPFVCGSRGEVAALVVGIMHTSETGAVFESSYAHLSRVDVRVGDTVDAGDTIGASGSTGCASGPHLHFAVYRHLSDGRRVVVDPFGWEGLAPDPWEAVSGVKSFWMWKKGEAPEGDYSF